MRARTHAHTHTHTHNVVLLIFHVVAMGVAMVNGCWTVNASEL